MLSPSLICLDPSGGPGLPGPHVLEKREFEPRQTLCLETEGYGDLWESQLLTPPLGRRGQTSQKNQALGQPLHSSEGCLCSWMRTGAVTPPSGGGLPEATDCPPNRSSFLSPPNAQQRAPPLGRADTERNLFSSQQRGMI